MDVKIDHIECFEPSQYLSFRRNSAAELDLAGQLFLNCDVMFKV